MEDLIFIIFCLLSFINIKIKSNNSFFKDYISLENSSSIKGIFVWLIVVHHNRSYYTKKRNYLYIQILNCFGQKIVSLFLFYSGFGINESIKNKGLNYVKTLPIKALSLFLKFQIILWIFLFNNIILLGLKFNLKQYVLSIIFKESLGNSNWFAYTIICLYLYSYLSFRFIPQKYFFINLFLIQVMCFIHSYFTYNYFYPKRIYAVDNILSFITGIHYSLLKYYFDKILMKNDILYFGNITLLIVIYYNFYYYINNNIYSISITNSLFCLIIVVISMKIRFDNGFLIFLNTHSYSIYLLQRVVMKYIYNKNFFRENEFIRFFFIFISTLFISNTFDKTSSFINRVLKLKNNNLILNNK